MKQITLNRRRNEDETKMFQARPENNSQKERKKINQKNL